MSDFKNKLTSIQEQIQSLLAKEKAVTEKRKKEIGDFAEKFNLLTASDEIIAAAFADIENAIKLKDERVRGWQNAGEKLLNAKKSDRVTTQKSAAKASTA